MYKYSILILSGLLLSILYNIYGWQITVITTLTILTIALIAYIFMSKKREVIDPYIAKLFLHCANEDISSIQKLAAERNLTIKDLQDLRYYVNS
jgi:hypothetical protein